MKTFNTYEAARYYSIINPSDTSEYKSYYYDGQLDEHGFFVNGNEHGEYKSYYDDGQLDEHYFYVNGKLHGESKSYYDNGQLWEHCFYVNDEELYLEHLKDGSYKSRCILSTLFNGNVIDEDI